MSEIPLEDTGTIYESIVIGAGQAGLASSYYLMRYGINHLVLDANTAPGGAWSHRWDSLSMKDVHGVADLPASHSPGLTTESANQIIPQYFASYEKEFSLPLVRPVKVASVNSIRIGEHEVLQVSSSAGEQWLTQTIINATGTWTKPFIPSYPGMGTFKGQQFHTSSYPGPETFQGKRVLIVGGGASAVQFIGELATVAADILWATRNPPNWLEPNSFNGLEAVTRVEQRIVAGLPPTSVVGATGLALREQEKKAQEMGFYDRRLPMFSSLTKDGATWVSTTANGEITTEKRFFDAIIWATGFRQALDHLAPLRLRDAKGGIALARVQGNVQGATTTLRNERINLVGYGPSASTIGAPRAARQAALSVKKYLIQN